MSNGAFIQIFLICWYSSEHVTLNFCTIYTAQSFVSFKDTIFYGLAPSSSTVYDVIYGYVFFGSVYFSSVLYHYLQMK